MMEPLPSPPRNLFSSGDVRSLSINIDMCIDSDNIRDANTELHQIDSINPINHMGISLSSFDQNQNPNSKDNNKLSLNLSTSPSNASSLLSFPKPPIPSFRREVSLVGTKEGFDLFDPSLG